MKVLTVRNAHSGLPYALRVLEESGVRRDSRNGPVFQFPEPVTTVFERPLENVVVWPSRNCNPFFHLYESLWLLAGRNDVAPLIRYVKQAGAYSDDGVTLHGSYGYRWRNHFSLRNSDEFGKDAPVRPHDQLAIIVEDLKKNPESRRCVLQMWDANIDLGRNGKDLPCNTMATFQRGPDGELNIVVFCRSNDIVWGLFGANAVQFSVLLEYVALWIGCPVGTYSQVSVNFHAYDNETWKQCLGIRPDRANFVDDPYRDGRVHHVPMSNIVEQIDTSPIYNVGDIKKIDSNIKILLASADSRIFADRTSIIDPWTDMVWRVLKAHHLYKSLLRPFSERYEEALECLAGGDPKADFIVAAREWIQRRYDLWKMKQGLLDGEMSHP